MRPGPSPPREVLKKALSPWATLPGERLSLDRTLRCIYTVVMEDLSFAWDDRKNQANKQKHGVSFEEASTVFFDENAVEFYDDEHSGWEDRFLLWNSYYVRTPVRCGC
jgi:hypothetical protein